MLKSKRLFIASLALGIAVFGAAAFGAVWYTQLRASAPAGVDISSVVESIQPSSKNSANSSGTGLSDADMVGTWKLASDSVSFVGYRVKEELRGIGSTTAV